MSETWTSLLSGVVGAIVGGAASLAGTMVVNKRQMATNARMRLYDELLPRLVRAVEDVSDRLSIEQVQEVLAAVRRASAITGPVERKAAHRLQLIWKEYTDDVLKSDLARGSSDGPPLHFSYELHRRLQEEIEAFSDHLGTKLG